MGGLAKRPVNDRLFELPPAAVYELKKALYLPLSSESCRDADAVVAPLRAANELVDPAT